MKYEKQINRAFSELRVLPRKGQREAVSMVLEQFFELGKDHVVLSADTGTGKSIIAAAIAKCFDQLNPQKLSAFTLMQNNALVNQYADTFGKFPAEEFWQIKGAGNYSCPALAELTNDPSVTAEDCASDTLPEPMVNKFCSNCQFQKSKKIRNSTKNLITNYAYYLISKMWSQHLDARPLTIFDEAHTLNEVFCDHNAIFFNVERLTEYGKEAFEIFGDSAKEEINLIKDVRSALKKGEINDENYMGHVRQVFKAYKGLAQKLEEKMVDEPVEAAMKTKRVYKKYFNLGCKIGDLIQHNYDHVFEYRGGEEQSVSVKPVFIGKMSKLILGQKNLFMSATISDKYIIDTLELDPDKVGFVKLPPVFDPSSKLIVFVGDQALNYFNMNDPVFVSGLAKKCSMIVNSHATENEKGLILVPSFKVAEQIANGITGKARVFLHDRNTKLNDLIAEFKSYTKSAVLISPSIFEGLDFAGDNSRFQILLKAPYPSLGEKRMKHIADNYGEIYRLMTLKKIIQGIGRSVRSEDDYATTYVLDANIKKLFNSPLNVWKDQFEVE